MLKFFLKFCKGGQKCCCRKGCRAVGRTDGCAGAENMAAKGLGSKAEKVQKSDRGFVAGSGSRTAGLKETGANRSWVYGEHRRADRGFEGNRRAQVAAKI